MTFTIKNVFMPDETMTDKSREAINYILKVIAEGIPEAFTYHTIGHTTGVLSVAEKLGKSENVDPRSLELLCVAAAWHDCGYLSGSSRHEEEGCHTARRILPDYGFHAGEIDEICNLIMATKIPTNPGTLLQKIICDADLHYLGTDRYEFFAGLLFTELLNFGQIKTGEEWIEKQISFLSAHRFFTETAIRLYDNQKWINLDKLKNNRK